MLRDIFGESRKEIWKNLSEQVGGEFVKGGFCSGDKVIVHHEQWTLTLDMYVVSDGKTSSTYTRMRAPYVNADGFRFKIYRKGFFSNIGKALGFKDVEIGIEDFDEEFVIKGNDEQKLISLFSDAKLRTMMQNQRRFHLEVKDDEGWFGGKFPEGVDELYFLADGVIKDIDTLKGLFDIYAEILNQLCLIGSAYKDNPEVKLK